jgi:hypothetical protein
MRSPIHVFSVMLLALAAGGGSALAVSSCGSESGGSTPRYTYVAPTQKRQKGATSDRSKAQDSALTRPKSVAGRADVGPPSTNTSTVVRTKTAKATTVTVPRIEQRTTTRTVTRTVVAKRPARTVTRTVVVTRPSQP